MTTFRVDCSRTTYEICTIEVEADNHDDAMNIAEKQAKSRDSDDWELDEEVVMADWAQELEPEKKSPRSGTEQ